MSQDLRSPASPLYSAPARTAKTPMAAGVWMAFLSVVMSGTLIGGMLGLFEMHAEDAVIARASVKHAPADRELAVRAARPAVRG
jgi:hypothetical protein